MPVFASTLENAVSFVVLDPFTIFLEGKTCTVMDAKGGPEYTRLSTGNAWKRVVGFCRVGRAEPEFYVGSAGRWYNPATVVYKFDIEQPFATFRGLSAGLGAQVLSSYGEPVVDIRVTKQKRPSMIVESAKILGITGVWARLFAPTKLKVQDPAAHRELTFACGRAYEMTESGRLVGRLEFAADLAAVRFVPLHETKYVDRRGLIGWAERRLQGMIQEQKQSSG